MTNAEPLPTGDSAVHANGVASGNGVDVAPVTAKDTLGSKPPAEQVKIADDSAGATDVPAVVTPTSTLNPSVAAPKSYSIGDRVSALASFDRTHHPADVIDVRREPANASNANGEDSKQNQNDDPSTISSYYVRYVGFDKRLDEWLPLKHLEPWSAAVEEEVDELGPTSPRAGDAETPRTRVTRNLKRRYNEINNKTGAVEDLAPIDQKLEKEHDERTKVKNVKVVQCGPHEVDAWYFSPYPVIDKKLSDKSEKSGVSQKTDRTDLTNGMVGAPAPPHVQCDTLYVCERCLKYVRKRSTLAKHEAKCTAKHPPGKMIYEHKRNDQNSTDIDGNPKPLNDLAFWEVDGSKMKVYCQNLCLLAKLFLDHKTLYFDVSPFMFYVLTEKDPATGNHVAVGYFSKEKYSLEEYNLACILTLPPYQRRGYGNLLISMSYELSKREGKLGTPERPLSDLGQVSYRSFWCRVVLSALHRNKASLSLKDLSSATGFRESDIASALTSLNLLKYWKGQHIVSATPKIVEDHMRSFSSNNLLTVSPEWMRWEPAPVAQPVTNRRWGANR